ncbi:hypothetical protein HZA98_04730 [Candidatus Woesearchaeota archaeon]|nr:hypothetical protein [Candidatus Woesearchaeota archaeon]
MKLVQTIKAIKKVKIQGAENVATAALKALESVTTNTKAKTKVQFLLEIKQANKMLFKSRPTEPEMRNYCNEILSFIKKFPENDIQQVKHAAKEHIKHTLIKKQERKELLVKVGEIFLVNEIKKKNLIIYTHCHSSTVTSIIKKASKKKKIEVRNTETRPLFQGRTTAKELASVGIKVTHFVDAAMIEAIKDADLILTGADAVTNTAVYNKIGSELLAQLANHYHIPLYICTSLWKYDAKKEQIEQRNPNEVWDHTPKNIHIQNPAFERIHIKHIKKFICEHGVLKSKKFFKQAKRTQSFL